MMILTVEELVAGIDDFTYSHSPSDFDRGVDIADRLAEMTIDTQNAWGGYYKGGGPIKSVERIGHYPGSVDFIRGVLSTDCPIRVFRSKGVEISEFALIAGL